MYFTICSWESKDEWPEIQGVLDVGISSLGQILMGMWVCVCWEGQWRFKHHIMASMVVEIEHFCCSYI